MADLKTLVEREMDRAGSPSYAFEDLVDRRDRRHRNRRIAAAAVALGLVLGLALLGSSLLRSAPEPRPADDDVTTRLTGNGRIVVSQAKHGIWILDPEDRGAAPELLLDDPDFPNAGLAFSPDGTRLAYTIGEGYDPDAPAKPSFGLWILDLATGAAEHVTTCSFSCSWLIDWSPDGSRFAMTNGDGLYVMDLDGNRRRIFAAYPRGEIGQPSWSPDGSRIAFSVRTGGDGVFGPSRLYTIGPDGSDLTVVLERRWNGVMDPAWSPDGTQFAYLDWGTSDAYRPETTTESSLPKIWVVDADGSDPRALYYDRNGIGPGSFYGGVTWSPDGTQIAFVLNWEFFVMNADGSGLRTADFPKQAAFGYRPAWQPIEAGGEVDGG